MVAREHHAEFCTMLRTLPYFATDVLAFMLYFVTFRILNLLYLKSEFTYSIKPKDGPCKSAAYMWLAEY